jgi:hypothetical protein
MLWDSGEQNMERKTVEEEKKMNLGCFDCWQKFISFFLIFGDISIFMQPKVLWRAVAEGTTWEIQKLICKFVRGPQVLICHTKSVCPSVRPSDCPGRFCRRIKTRNCRVTSQPVSPSPVFARPGPVVRLWRTRARPASRAAGCRPVLPTN